MSHYTVLVIGDDIEGQLAPFDENIEMPEYQQGEVGIENKNSFRETYTIFEEGRSYGTTSEEAIINLELSFEELYKKYGEDWNGNCWKKHTDGEWFEYSTYNPKSKWDWFSVGGRWSGMLKLKDGRMGEEGERGVFNKDEEIKEGFCDSAKKGDIDFSMDEEECKKARLFWDIYVDGKKPKNEEEKKMSENIFYKRDYYIKRYKNKKNYVKSMGEFGTFAVLKDGEWLEAGEMGWFGCSSETPEESRDWDKGFYDKFIKDLDDDVKLTVVDCHI